VYSGFSHGATTVRGALLCACNGKRLSRSGAILLKKGGSARPLIVEPVVRSWFMGMTISSAWRIESLPVLNCPFTLVVRNRPRATTANIALGKHVFSRLNSSFPVGNRFHTGVSQMRPMAPLYGQMTVQFALWWLVQTVGFATFDKRSMVSVR
jgi:hypothetical protein